jgi:hypothetical protein
MPIIRLWSELPEDGRLPIERLHPLGRLPCRRAGGVVHLRELIGVRLGLGTRRGEGELVALEPAEQVLERHPVRRRGGAHLVERLDEALVSGGHVGEVLDRSSSGASARSAFGF